MIEIELFDGTVLEFPEGTDQAVIDRVAQQETASRKGQSEAPAGWVAEGSGPSFTAEDGDRAQRVAAMMPLTSSVRGLPFVGSYGDEAVGVVGGEGARREYQDAAALMEEQHPGMDTALRLGSGITATGALLKGAQFLPAALQPGFISNMGGKSLARRTLASGGGAALGAGAEGAIYGAGIDEDGTRGGNAAKYGVMQALIGGGIGSAMPIVGDALQAGANKIADVANRVSRPATLPGMSREASDQVLTHARYADVAGEGLDEIRRAGGQGILADIPGMQSLTDQAVNMSPAGANIAGRAVNDRAAAAGTALGQSFDAVMGGPEGSKAISRSIREAAQPGIKNAYQTAYQAVIDYSTQAGQKIRSILDRAPQSQVQAAIEKAKARMVWDGIENSQLPEVVIENGQVQFRKPPNVMQLDYIKRAFDSIAEDGTDAFGKMTDDARFAGNVARTLKKAIGEAVPDYLTALGRASDEFTLQRSVRMGEGLLSPNTTREAVTDWLDGAGALDRQAAIRALRSNIDERIANATHAAGVPEGVAEARKIFANMSSKAARTKMRAVLGDQADAVFRALDEAEKALELRTTVARGSDTAPRMVGDAQLKTAQDYSAGGIVREAASGGVASAPKRVLEIAAANTPADKAARNEEIYREIAQLLTGPKGQAAEDAAKQIAAMLNYIPQRQQASAAIGDIVSKILGLAGYQSATQAQRTPATSVR